jgi:hypothetical protein
MELFAPYDWQDELSIRAIKALRGYQLRNDIPLLTRKLVRDEIKKDGRFQRELSRTRGVGVKTFNEIMDWAGGRGEFRSLGREDS